MRIAKQQQHACSVNPQISIHAKIGLRSVFADCETIQFLEVYLRSTF